MEAVKEISVSTNSSTKGSGRVGYKSTKFGWIPEEWDEVKLGAITIKSRLGGNYIGAQENRGVPLIKMGNLGRGDIVLNKVERLVPDDEIDPKDILKVGDLLFNTRNTLDLVGKVAVWKEEFPGAVYNSNILKIDFDTKKVLSNHFMNYVFNSHYGLRQLREFATGTTSVAAIYARDLWKFKVFLPPLPEQRKIAQILSTWDKAIAHAHQLIEKKQQLKKGLMQQLLTGKKRFLGFNEGWKKVKLRELCEVKRGAGSQYLTYVEQSSEGNIRLIRITDFLSNVPKYVQRTKDIERFLLAEGDLLIAGTGATAGISFEVPSDYVGMAYSYNAPRIRVNESASKKFILYCLKSEMILRQQSALFTGNAQPFLDTKAIRSFKVMLPSVEEQQKIAVVLSTCDREIQILTTQLAALKQQKKGLMQVLLTGKIRVCL